MEDQYPDRIFVKDNLTTAEKLLFANTYIKELKKQIEELKLELSQKKIEIGKILSHNEELKSVTKQEKVQAQKDHLVQLLQNKCTDQKKIIKGQKADIERLIIEILKYKK